jgi:aminoglycoside phosphotransferase (APT) family kinase protein
MRSRGCSGRPAPGWCDPVDPADLTRLATGLSFVALRERLQAAGHTVREKHSGGGSALIIDGEEIVVRYPPRGAPAAWRCPHDPALPWLARVGELLASAAWEPELVSALASAGVERRLMYNPARRAAFLLRPRGGSAPVVLKLLSAEEAPGALSALGAVAASGLPERVPMPRLVATAPAAGALLLDWLPGAPVAAWTPDVLAQVAAILAGVHGLGLDGLPAWSPQRDLAKLDRLLWLLATLDAGAAAALRPTAAALADRLRGAPARTTTIHRDFTRRHVLLVPGGGAPRVGILDWDSLSTGPPEKDLATLAAGIGDAGPELLERYETATGRALDRELVAALVDLQRLTRACRRLLAGERPPVVAT